MYIKSDFCYFCGAIVHQDKWREHMLIKHKAVLTEDPKPKGEWSKDYKLAPFPRRWQKMKGI